MKKELYTVGEIFSLKILMGKKGPLKSKPEVLRLVRKLKHRTVIRNGQKTYQVPLLEIIEHNKRMARVVHIPILADGDTEIDSSEIE